MSSDFVGELIVGSFFIVHSWLCTFGRRAYATYSLGQNEKMLVNPRPSQIGLCLFGMVYIGLGIYVGLYDKAAPKAGPWPMIFMSAMGIALFLWAKYFVRIQAYNVRSMQQQLENRVTNVAMTVMGCISGPLGIALIIGLFFMK